MLTQLQQVSQLPSLPTVAIRLLKTFSDPDVSISDIVSIIHMDPALAGKVLKAANTSRFGIKRPVSDLQRAVVLLGKKSVMALALGFSLAEASMTTGPYANLFSDFWFQSLVRGCAASLLAERYGDVDAGEAFTIGLLSRIGRLALLNHDPERLIAAFEQSEESGVSVDAIEADQSDITSQQITLHLLREWKLPEHCVQAVAQIPSTLEEACSRADDQPITLTDILRIATAFSEFFSGENRGLAIARVYELAGAILNETDEGANSLVDQIRQEIDDHSDLFAVDMSKVASPMQLLSQAMGQLSMLVAASAMARDETRGTPSEIMEENGRLRKRVMELTQSSMTDSLTALFNRAYLLQQLQDRAVLASDTQTLVGLLFIDVDHFKSVNDTYGHLLGDQILQTLADVLRSTVRDSDVVCRYGGEEFVILTAAPDLPGLQRQAERIREKVELAEFGGPDARLRITVSIGGAMAVPEPHDAIFCSRLLDAADSAMYRSKRSGRNRVTITDSLQGMTTEEAADRSATRTDSSCSRTMC